MSAATVHVLPSAAGIVDEGQDHAATVAAMLDQLDQLAPRLADQLRALLLDLTGNSDEIQLRRQLCAEAHERGRAEGWRAGYEQAVIEWKITAAGLVLDGTPFAQLDRRRYPPDGRLSWIIPRGGDPA